jgi:hypothetical protein
VGSGIAALSSVCSFFRIDWLWIKWKEAVTKAQATVVTPAPTVLRASSSRRFRDFSSRGRLLSKSSWKIVGYWALLWALSSPFIIAMILAFKSFECGLVLGREGELRGEVPFVERGPGAEQVPISQLLHLELIARSGGQLISKTV